ncbi:hypothetical protein B0J12DRAFT_696818 [Macrophomina phaseolina]|uniref:Uncharacterized protein n=1 Tax=Macrophomina phaseolina TaxID=35725 RepID=A0ABQ8GKR0_9PEZI|nr:hypothetical protein B0J12DRAFT_696818 [Macrophomina phaseolina]
MCDWIGGGAVSLQLNHTHSEQFRAAGYAPLVAGGREDGAVREHGSFSSTRLYDAGASDAARPAPWRCWRSSAAHWPTWTMIAEGRTAIADTYATNNHGQVYACSSAFLPRRRKEPIHSKLRVSPRDGNSEHELLVADAPEGY